jgi:hypothetical protein
MLFNIEAFDSMNARAGPSCISRTLVIIIKVLEAARYSRQDRFMVHPQDILPKR